MILVLASITRGFWIQPRAHRLEVAEEDTEIYRQARFSRPKKRRAWIEIGLTARKWGVTKGTVEGRVPFPANG